MTDNFPNIILGTAMWGWTTPKETAFALLDEWYGRGFREVDAATNYPINKNPQDFRLAERILLEWIKANGVADLEVMMKIGSLNNLRTPEHLLTKSFILMMLDEYGWLFGENLRTLMVHWDNRDEAPAIRETFEALDVARGKGLQVGISGIRHPEIYAALNQEFQFGFRVQIKHNVAQSDHARYAPFHGRRRFIAYGINAGGLKLGPEKYSGASSLAARGGEPAAFEQAIEKVREAISAANQNLSRPLLDSFHQVGMIYAFYHPDMSGILLGTSNVAQLRESIDFYETLKTTGFFDVYQAL